MIRGLYTAATGMIHQKEKLDVIANNMANLNTRGYKHDRVVSRSFEEELLMRMGGDGSPGPTPIGTISHGVYVDSVVTSFEDGSYEQTNKKTDLALQGQGFFTVLAEDGPRYTRDGTFRVNEEGILVTMEGWEVAGQNGPIYIEQEDFNIDPQGNIFIGETLIDQLEIANFEDVPSLEKIGDNLYVNTDGDNQMVNFEGGVMQGYLETSNVSPVEEISDMIVASRNYESNQRILVMLNESLDKTVNEVGRI